MPAPNPVLSIQNLLCDNTTTTKTEEDLYTKSPSSQSECDTSTVSTLSPRTPPISTFRMSFPIFTETGSNITTHDYASPSSYPRNDHSNNHHISSPNPLTRKNDPSYHRHHPYRSPPAHGNYITINSDLICAHYLPTHSYSSVKAKRKRASPTQIMILEHVFEHTAFPSTGLREELGEKLGMEPRAVQIWFQNKRQSSKREQWDSTSLLGQQKQNARHHHQHQEKNHFNCRPYQ